MLVLGPGAKATYADGQTLTSPLAVRLQAEVPPGPFQKHERSTAVKGCGKGAKGPGRDFPPPSPFAQVLSYLDHGEMRAWHKAAAPSRQSALWAPQFRGRKLQQVAEVGSSPTAPAQLA